MTLFLLPVPYSLCHNCSHLRLSVASLQNQIDRCGNSGIVCVCNIYESERPISCSFFSGILLNGILPKRCCQILISSSWTLLKPCLLRLMQAFAPCNRAHSESVIVVSPRILRCCERVEFVISQKCAICDFGKKEMLWYSAVPQNPWKREPINCASLHLDAFQGVGTV